MGMATTKMSPVYSETEAFKVFASMVWEQHKERHPVHCIDPTRFAEIITEKWKTMTQKQKMPSFISFEKTKRLKHLLLCAGNSTKEYILYLV